ncbi:DEAD/DEAH box helicase [Serinicoccus sp. CUA-874]|uniref:DEAD/DEAH box helicase n=1 Tax=Serinicoccus sp. CUA-874 TaxID=1517939 RepID=UPI000A5AF03B|nr:DEAD/DEAH box helicase [Serinicoccus sp. CUA-874]
MSEPDPGSGTGTSAVDGGVTGQTITDDTAGSDDTVVPDAAEVLRRFSPATRAWFDASFAGPTPAQLGAWDAISRGEHTLVVAPTGSGKTLSAFLWAIDQITAHPRAPRPARPTRGRRGKGQEPAAQPEEPGRCRVLYVSPLKALAVDVERNLRSPLVGIGHAARRLGQDAPSVSVAVRSGDTPAAERRAFAKDGAEILITTPESLFLLLTSQARSALTGVESVIVDEVHAVAGTKRGAHLALTLDRLDHLLPRPAQRSACRPRCARSRRWRATSPAVAR